MDETRPRAARAASTLLRWTTPFAAIETILGAGSVTAGLVGGLLSFPPGWRVLTAVGAFLLASGVAAELVNRRGWRTVAAFERRDDAQARAVKWEGW
jgi:hypothetical protein